MNYCNCPNCRTDNCPAAKEELRSFLEGMEFAMRIVRNRGTNAPTAQARDEACVCEGIIRIVQVEIGSGRMPIPASTFTQEELDELDRIR